jgi:hypothetical protein
MKVEATVGVGVLHKPHENSALQLCAMNVHPGWRMKDFPEGIRHINKEQSDSGAGVSPVSDGGPSARPPMNPPQTCTRGNRCTPPIRC